MISLVFSGYKDLNHHHAVKPIPIVRSDTNKKNSRWVGGRGKGKNKLLGNRTESLYLYNKCNKQDGKVKESG